MAHGTFPQAAVDVSISELQSVEDQDLTSAADVVSFSNAAKDIPESIVQDSAEIICHHHGASNAYIVLFFMNGWQVAQKKKKQKHRQKLVHW